MKKMDSNFLFKNKKANVLLDGITILVVLIIFALAAIFIHKPMTEINNEFQDDDSLSNQTKEVMQKATAQYPKVMDSAFLMVLVILWIFGIVSSFLIDSHPAFFIFTFILMIIFFVVCIFLGNGIETLLGDAELATTSTTFQIMYWVLTHLLETFIPIVFTIAFALFAKWKWVS